MDDRLEKALEFSNYRMTIENQKKNLKIRMETQQTFMYQKGTWRADQLLISFIQSLLDNEFENAVIQDSRNTPIQIDDLHEFKLMIIEKYNEAMNEFLMETNKLSKARNIKKVMDW
jgi:DNA-binding ferritin-like protein (Dps family)